MASERAMRAAEKWILPPPTGSAEADPDWLATRDELAELIDTAADLPALEAKAARCEELDDRYRKLIIDSNELQAERDTLTRRCADAEAKLERLSAAGVRMLTALDQWDESVTKIIGRNPEMPRWKELEDFRTALSTKDPTHAPR